MQRGSDKHGPRQDDELKHETQGLEKANRPVRVEEWREPEPFADDDPQPRPAAAARLQQPADRGAREGGVQPQTLADVMTREVVTVPVEASVAETAEAMRDHDVGDVLVTSDGIVLAIVTDRDLVVRAVAERLDPAGTTVGDVCSSDLVTAHPGTPVEEAVRVMRVQALRRLPVVDDEGRPQGVVSIGDLALARDPQSALADISAAPPNR